LTGIIVSRGANFVNDLFDKLKTKKEEWLCLKDVM
jgi:hypothetical protein